MPAKSIAIILNAHLPFVRHPEFPRFLEEDWLFESISESYLPLLRMLNRLKAEHVPFSLTVSLSPTLCCMLSDPVLQERFLQYMERHVELGEKEVERCAAQQPEFLEMAQFYLDQAKRNLSDYQDVYRTNLLEAFKALESSGHLELATTAATHAYLPLYQEYPTAINAQVELGVQSFLTTFGHLPKGFWLPECGYYPGLEENLKYHGISWFQTASQSMLLSAQKVESGDYRPVHCPNQVAAFPRDFQATSLVWSNSSGYPTDRVYREFYRDIGYDLPMDYIKPYIHEPGVRVFTGYKYWAITGQTDQKVPYRRDLAQAKVAEHAKNFLYNLNRKGDQLGSALQQEPLFTLGFDAELFGHWWFEGIDWLEQVIRLASEDKQEVKLVTPSSFLAKEGSSLQTAQPAFSSWGQGGYSAVWLDGSNAWTYRHVHKAIERMEELAVRFSDQISLKQRFLNQAAREVLLAMASDWPFILFNKSSTEYAEKRLKNHLRNFNVVYGNMCKNAVNTEWLVKAEKRDIIFSDIDYNIFNPNR
ncbi:MAG: glycoside hydrolase family 57 protein [Sphaerochaeta sp.]|uniref:glycoside hydrolase family 57 protein n=2 Tax=Sphaerochaeta sp. TaxID=1972642 RepID=UPI003D0BD756